MFPAAHDGQELSHCYVNLARETRYHEKSNPGMKSWSVKIPLETVGFILLWKSVFICLCHSKKNSPWLLWAQDFAWGLNRFHPKFCHGDWINLQIKCVMVWREHSCRLTDITVGSRKSTLVTAMGLVMLVLYHVFFCMLQTIWNGYSNRRFCYYRNDIHSKRLGNNVEATLCGKYPE